uniref:Uncharacterized protein n=1 Tax=Rhizophora mucronata TaxID=61149 RepID=A0A2P2ITD6_RHIMU
MERSRGPRKPSKNKVVSVASSGMNCLAPEPESHVNKKEESSDYFDNYLWLGPKGDGGQNTLYPGDLVPFTRRPLFLIIDSDNSHAFKAGLAWCRNRRGSCLATFPFKAIIQEP